jgi:ABC-2 type transport system ATP-binding protein
MNAITVEGVSKEFSFKTQKGLKGFFSAEKKTVVAVDDISFEIPQGQSVAFIGPNGAGKSTTIKMLSGILQPTRGKLNVLGFEPVRQRRQLAMAIGTVFGQRSQLVYNLPLVDSFSLSAAMYQVPKAEAEAHTKKLVEQFDLAGFIDQPVRKLSLGQRMRAEVANALLHNPKIIFLDEPTIGLDIVAKRALRQVIKDVNRDLGTTVFLTSHDVGDIEEVCERTMIVNHGQIMLDAKTSDLKTDYLRSKSVSIVPEGELEPVTVSGIRGELKNGRLVFDVDTTKTPLKGFMQAVLEAVEIQDITIEDTPLEDIIHELYTKDKTDVAP